MRQRQLQDIFGNDVIYSGSSPLTLAQSHGTISPNDWQDFTDFTQNLDKMTFSWSTTQTPQGEVPEGQFLPKFGTSTQLTFEREAYEYLKEILVNNVAAPLNQVSVQITDQSNGVYSGYVIKSTDLSWCEFNSLCTFDTNIKQQDEWTQCVERTLIADNWQGMFSAEPTMEVAPGVLKKHPRFSYCTEHRPNGTLVALWYMIGLLGMFSIIVASIIVVLDIIKLIVNAVISFIDFLGGSISFLPITDPSSVFDSIAQLYIEAAGCGREHPAPLVRDYISNVCDKCGIRYDATTVDIFFAPILSVQKSDGITYNEPNPHYNACLFFPQLKRGIRRYASINLFGTSVKNTATFYDPNNQPVWALSDMLDHLKKVYNAQWQIRSDASGQPFLHFHRKDYYRDQAPLYDFSTGGVDRSKLLEGICYTPTDFVAPASMNGLYQDDPADKCGHENGRQMNGDPVSFNNTLANPLFHGVLNKLSGFGATKFRLDGSTTDYIYDAGQTLLNSAIIVLTIIPQMDTVFCFVRKYCDFAVLLQGETTSLPKVIIWDGKDNNTAPCENSDAGNKFLNARAVTKSVWIGSSETTTGTEYLLGKTAWPGSVPGISMPDINTKYPQYIDPSPTISLLPPATLPLLLDWNDPLSFPPQVHVIGHSLSVAPPIPGEYTIQTYFGSVISTQAAILVNYPMYFNPYYKDSLWDWFHWIDDPYAFPLLHKNWHLKIPLCGPDLDKLGAIGDGYQIQLLQPILLDTSPYSIGIITEIEVCYDNTDGGSGSPGTGQYIQLKGIV